MKSYHFIKKYTQISIFLTLALIICNLGFFGFEITKVYPTKQAKAGSIVELPTTNQTDTFSGIPTTSQTDTSTPSTDSVCSSISNPADFSVSSVNSGTVLITITRNTTSAFDYYFIVKDSISGATLAMSNSGSAPAASVVDLGNYKTTVLVSGGMVNVIGYFTVHSDQNTSCPFTVEHDNIQIGNASAGIDLSVGASSYPVDSTNPTPPEVTGRFKFTGHENQTYYLNISDCSNQYWQKDTGTIQDGKEYPIDWKPDSSSGYQCTHTIQVQVGSPSDSFYDVKTTTVSIGDGSDDNSGAGTETGASYSADELTDKPITVCSNSDGIECKITEAFTLPKSISGVGDVFQLILKLLLYFAGVFGFFSLTMGGIQFITSGGDPTKAAKAKKTLIYSVIGILIAVLSLTIQLIAANFWQGPK